jgi:hypothetical protein
VQTNHQCVLKKLLSRLSKICVENTEKMAGAGPPGDSGAVRQPKKTGTSNGLDGTRRGFAVPMSRVAFVQMRGGLNIVIDKQIIVTNACYIRLGSIVFLPNVRGGRSLISEGAVSAKLCECSVQENRRTAASASDMPRLFRHCGDVQPGH